MSKVRVLNLILASVALVLSLLTQNLFAGAGWLLAIFYMMPGDD